MSFGSAILMPQPRWVWIPVRVLLVTFLLTLLSFAVSLFVAIVGMFTAAVISGARPNMPMAYRHFALPFAAAIALVVLICTTVVEVRRFRQTKALAAIERTN
jgi:low affinity Fe/Cu permease